MCNAMSKLPEQTRSPPMSGWVQVYVSQCFIVLTAVVFYVCYGVVLLCR